METTWVDVLTRALNEGRPRRGLLALIAGSGVTWLGIDAADAKKKRKKKKKCGKPGNKPVKGKCCAKTVSVDGKCRTCDVCASGCAFATLQAAIDAASPETIIAVCPGTYVGALTIDKNLWLIGAGDGTGATATILRGVVNTPVVTTNTGTTVLQNLRITGGSGSIAGSGVGILILSGSVEVNTCTVTGNKSPNTFGGGIFNDGTLHLIDSTVSDNESPSGGGIWNDPNRSLTLTNTEILSNTATEGVGGGIMNYTGANVLIDAASRITGNTAMGMLGGGGIYNNNGTVTLTSSANVSGNTPNNCAGNTVPNCIN